MAAYAEILAVIAVLFAFSIISYRKKSLSLDGIFFANIFGILIYAMGGIMPFATTVLFFAIAEISTKYSRSKLGLEHEKRTVSNIVGNGLPALISIFLGSPIAFYGAISAALSDTVSSEIGLLSKSKPRLITRLNETVERGVDGGVSLLGAASGIIAAIIIALICYFVTNKPEAIIVITIAGFGGSVVDSILGAELERKGIIGNTTVNFIASLFGAVVAYGLLR